MRSVRALAAGVAVAALVSPLTASAAEPAPIIVFYAPADSPADVAEARTALNRVALQRGTALVDLSPAADVPPSATRDLSRGIEAYHNFQYEDSLGHLDTGLAEAAQTGADGLDVSELSDLLLYRALAYTQTGDTASAWDEFVKAAVIDPTRQLDPVRFPPRVVETYLRAVDSVTAGAWGTVTIEVPDACEVRFDGRNIDPKGPLSTAWGEHYLRVSCTGYPAYGAVIAVDRVEMTVTPPLEKPLRPTLLDARTLATERGATALIWAVVTVSAGAPPTLRMAFVDAASGSERGSVTTNVGGSAGGRKEIGAAAEKLIDDIITPTIQIVETPAGRSWYEHPLFWGAVGVAVTAAILLPFAIDDSAATGFEVRPGGALPP